MSDPPTSYLDPRLARLVADFQELTTGDQDLVAALIARLRTITDLGDDEFPPDVPFMDFDE